MLLSMKSSQENHIVYDMILKSHIYHPLYIETALLPVSCAGTPTDFSLWLFILQNLLYIPKLAPGGLLISDALWAGAFLRGGLIGGGSIKLLDICFKKVIVKTPFLHKIKRTV